MLIVQVGDFGTDGDAHYRIHAPARFMGLIAGVVCVDVHFHHHFHFLFLNNLHMELHP